MILLLCRLCIGGVSEAMIFFSWAMNLASPDSMVLNSGDGCRLIVSDNAN